MIEKVQGHYRIREINRFTISEEKCGFPRGATGEWENLSTRQISSFRVIPCIIISNLMNRWWTISNERGVQLCI